MDYTGLDGRNASRNISGMTIYLANPARPDRLHRRDTTPDAVPATRPRSSDRQARFGTRRCFRSGEVISYNQDDCALSRM
jgi:hypothetical protein